MWKKDEDDGDERSQAPEARREASPGADRTEKGSVSGQAVIGDSIRIQGEVTGDEDLTIQGHVDGSVNLEQQTVTVGPDGEVQADIVARVITVEGRVEGDLTAGEQVVVRSSARVEGDISAPRVVLEDGAHFRGGVEMDKSAGADRREGSSRAGDGRRSSRPDRATPESGSSSEQKERENAGGEKDVTDTTTGVAG